MSLLARLAASGESGRALGATFAIHFGGRVDAWTWRPDRGELIAPGSAARGEGGEPWESALELPPATILVGPIPLEEQLAAESMLGRLLAAGHEIAAIGSAPTAAARSGRIDLVDGLLDDRGAPSGCHSLRPWLPGGSSTDAAYFVPMDTAPEAARRLAAWAEAAGDGRGDEIFAWLFHERVWDDSPPLRPLPWSKHRPDLSHWAGAHLRCQARQLEVQGRPAEAAELDAAARRIESLHPPLDRVVAAGLLEQVPGLGTVAREALAQLLL